MLKRFALVALLCAGSAQAATLEGPKFTVEYTALTWPHPSSSDGPASGDVSVGEDSVTWANAAYVTDLTWPVGGTAYYDGTFSFQAKPGYAITGYTVGYSVALSEIVPWTVRGDEDFMSPTDNRGNYDPGRTVGSVISGTGAFLRDGGSEVLLNIDNPTRTFADTFTTLPRLSGRAESRPIWFCILEPIRGGGAVCGIDPFLPVDISMSLTITPTVVTQVPEPETYALLLVGLAALGWRRRHCSVAPRS